MVCRHGATLPLMFGFLASLAIAGLSGCASMDDTNNHQNMLLDSESCRSDSEFQLSSRSLNADRTTQDRASLFDKTYRSCMDTKGYAL